VRSAITCVALSSYVQCMLGLPGMTVFMSMSWRGFKLRV
jgi:hypothetical protein